VQTNRHHNSYSEPYRRANDFAVTRVLISPTLEADDGKRKAVGHGGARLVAGEVVGDLAAKTAKSFLGSTEAKGTSFNSEALVDGVSDEMGWMLASDADFQKDVAVDALTAFPDLPLRMPNQGRPFCETMRKLTSTSYSSMLFSVSRSDKLIAT